MKRVFLTVACSFVVPSIAYAENVGVGLMTVDLEYLKDTLKDPVRLPTKEGVCVIGVMSYSPAATAKLQPLDIIVRIDKEKISTPSEFDSYSDNLPADTPVKFSIFRRSNPNNNTLWTSKTVMLTPVAPKTMYSNATRVSTDEVRGINFVHHKDSPDAVNEKSDVQLYFTFDGTKASNPRLKISYVAKDWLFIRKFTVKADQKTFSLVPPEMKRDNSSTIWEWCDIPLTAKNYDAIKEAATSVKVILRHEGDDYYKDRELNRDEQQRLFVMLMAYKAYGGEYK